MRNRKTVCPQLEPWLWEGSLFSRPHYFGFFGPSLFCACQIPSMGRISNTIIKFATHTHTHTPPPLQFHLPHSSGICGQVWPSESFVTVHMSPSFTHKLQCQSPSQNPGPCWQLSYWVTAGGRTRPCSLLCLSFPACQFGQP